MNYSILMADIISSRSKNSKELMSQFKELIKQINLIFKSDILSPLTITLGDEFQGVVKSDEVAIKIIFALEECIVQHEYKFKLKYVLNNGIIDTEINKKNAYEMLGEGLTKARKLLNENKGSENRFLISLNEKDDFKEEYINKVFLIYQNYVDNWKSKDMKAVYNFLKYDDYKIVGNILNIDRSSAWRRKKSLNINEYKITKELILQY